MVRHSLGNALRQDSSRDYWTEVKKMSKSRSTITSEINGYSNSSDIANVFAGQYTALYSSVVSTGTAHMLHDINCSIKNVCFTDSSAHQHCHFLNSADVIKAIMSLRAGKTDPIDKLYSDNFKHYTDYLIHCIVMIINCMLCHGVAPNSFFGSTVVPIPKSLKLDLGNCGNYRAIALSSIFGKILDKIILEKQSEQLKTSDMQFGFKQHSSTIMCSSALIETVDYYVQNNSSVYVLLIDASKAFDRVSHSLLFDVLKHNNVCPVILRLLSHIYSNSDMNVRWQDTLSDTFPLLNGVKQGGVMSPTLFTLYIDSLLDRLKQSGFGCHIGLTYAGAFGYADDIALVAPSLFGLRRMISICESFAI